MAKMTEKDYLRPIDAAYFPEGCERCTFLRFLLYLTPILLLGCWGLYAAYKVLATGLGVTGLDDYFGFGLWIAFDLGVIALGAGAFFTGALRYLLNIDKLKNIINMAVILGFLCYTGALLILVMDIGQPLRCWFGYWHPNVHSMLTEVIFCITCYAIVLTLEYIPIILENRQINKNTFCHYLAHNFHVVMPIFAGLGAFLSTFHQGSLGGMYGVLIGRPFVLRDNFFIWPWVFFLYILSAIGCGPMFTVLMTTALEKVTKRRLVSWDVKLLMGKIAGVMYSIYIFFKLIDTYFWAADVLPRSGVGFTSQFHGFYYGQWLFWLEIVVCGIFPAYILIRDKYRQRPVFFYLGGFLACFGVLLNRWNMTVQTLAIPVMPFDKWEVYLPNWAEWGCVALIFAFAWCVVALAYRYLPVFPQEKYLNTPSGEY